MRLILDAASAARLHLELNQSESKAAGLGSASHAVQKCLVNDLTMGSFHVSSLKAVVMDLSHVNEARSQLESAPCDGVVGADVLATNLAVIDYASLKLYLKVQP